MYPDSATILVVTGLLAAVAGSLLWAFERTQKPGIPQLRTWAYASLLQAVGLGCAIGLRSALPAQTGILFGNFVLMLALVIYGKVIADFTGYQIRKTYWVALWVAYAVLHAGFLYLWPNLPARMAIFSLFAAIIFAVSAAQLRFTARASLSGQRFVSALFLFTSIGLLLRAAIQYPFAPAADDVLFASSGHAGLFHLMALISYLVVTLGFTALCIERSRSENDRALREIDSQREIFRKQFEMLPVAACIWRIEDNDYVLEQANFAAQVLTEGRIWTQTGARASQLLARNPEALEALNQCRDKLNYFVREVPTNFDLRDLRPTYNLTFSRISPEYIAVYGEPKKAEDQAAH